MKVIIFTIVFLNLMTSLSSQIFPDWSERPKFPVWPKVSTRKPGPTRKPSTHRTTRFPRQSTTKLKGNDDDGDSTGGQVGIVISIENPWPSKDKITTAVTTPCTTSGIIQPTTSVPNPTPHRKVSQSKPTPVSTKVLLPTPTPIDHIMPTSTRGFTHQPRHTAIVKISTPNPAQTWSERPHGTHSRGIFSRQPSPTRQGATWTTMLVTPTRHPTQEPKKINKDLQKLMKKKVTKENAMEVSTNMTKVFQKSPAKDMTKDDAVMAAQLLENIVAVTEMLNETAENVVGFIDSMMEMNTTTLAESGSTAARIIKVLDNLVEYIPFKEGERSMMINKTNIVLQANLVKPETFEGIHFGVSNDNRPKRSVQKTNKKSTSISLPREVVRSTNMSSVRIGFIFHAFNKLFQSNITHEGEVSDSVVSGSVFGTNVVNLEEPVIIRLPRRSQQSKIGQCVFWVDSDRQWSKAGCSLCPKQTSSDSVECCCNHLTSFAVLFSPEKDKQSGDVHQKILSIISYVGCVISILGVVFTFITYSMFRHLRKTNQQPILMNLCIAIALLLIVFVSGIDSTGNKLGCQIVAVLLHYLTLVTVLWMGIEAYNLYLQIVKVMAIYQRKFMLKAALVGWGAPLVIVLGTVGLAIYKHKKTDGQMEFYYGSKHVCILHNEMFRLVTWFGPVLIILCLNFIAFIAIVYKLSMRHNPLPKDPKTNYIKNCWTALAIMCLLGLTWLFGALAISDAKIVFEYLFCIFNSLQGFFIFFFHCVRIKEVRSQWSLFVSGLGLSHGDSENSQQRSRVLERLRKDSDLQHMRNFTYGCTNDSERPKRKVTVVTVVGEDGHDPNSTLNIENRTFSSASHCSTHL